MAKLPFFDPRSFDLAMTSRSLACFKKRVNVNMYATQIKVLRHTIVSHIYWLFLVTLYLFCPSILLCRLLIHSSFFFTCTNVRVLGNDMALVTHSIFVLPYYCVAYWFTHFFLLVWEADIGHGHAMNAWLPQASYSYNRVNVYWTPCGDMTYFHTV